MRDYVLTQSHLQASDGLTVMARMVCNWKHRRQMEKLLKLDDHLLHDMGLTREMLVHLAALPLTINMDWEKERVLRSRGIGPRHTWHP